MEIVKTGKDPAEYTGRYRCKKTSSTILFNGKEVYKAEFKIAGYFFDGTDMCIKKPFIKCPLCNEEHIVKVPKYVFNNAIDDD